MKFRNASTLVQTERFGAISGSSAPGTGTRLDDPPSPSVSRHTNPGDCSASSLIRSSAPANSAISGESNGDLKRPRFSWARCHSAGSELRRRSARASIASIRRRRRSTNSGSGASEAAGFNWRSGSVLCVSVPCESDNVSSRLFVGCAERVSGSCEQAFGAANRPFQRFSTVGNGEIIEVPEDQHASIVRWQFSKDCVRSFGIDHRVPWIDVIDSPAFEQGQ